MALLAVFRQRRHWFDYAVFGIRAIWGLLGITGLHFSTGAGGVLLWLAAAGYVLSCCVPFVLYLTREVPRYIPVAAELLITGGLYLLLPEMNESVFAFFQVPFLTLGYLCSGWYPLGAAVLAAFFLPVLLSGGVSEMPRNVFVDATANLIILQGIGFCFQKLVTSYQKINGMYRIIQEQNATLEVYAKQIERLTLAEERSRLSRDLHDTVGHTFTATIMGMDAVYYLIDVAPDEAKNNLRELLQLTRNGLDEVRQHIHGIAAEKVEEPLSFRLRQIGSEFEQHTGMKVTLVTEGQEERVPEQARITLIRCLQESLTNAKKHGGASSVTVNLTYREGNITLGIADNGSGAARITRGFGLEAMEQRAANLNGNVEITSSSGEGMVITCTLPVRHHAVSGKREGA